MFYSLLIVSTRGQHIGTGVGCGRQVNVHDALFVGSVREATVNLCWFSDSSQVARVVHLLTCRCGRCVRRRHWPRLNTTRPSPS